MTIAAHLEEPTIPHPPRFWWLKRIAICFVVLSVIFIAVIQWWGHVAHQRLGAEIDAIHARGEPILVQDFQVKPIPDQLNAARSLIAAQNGTPLLQSQQAFLDKLNLDTALDASAMNSLEQIVQATAAKRQLARAARFQPKVDWGTKITTPAVNIMLPSLSKQRDLTTLLIAAGQYEHEIGHDAEAIEIVRDILRQSDLLERESPTIVAHLVAIGINGQAYSLARKISYDLNVLHDSTATTSPSSAASPAQVRALIDEFLDERAFRDGGVNAVLGERMMMYDASVTRAGRAVIGADPRVNPLAHLGVLQPMFELDALHMMQLMGQVVSASSTTNYPTASALMPDLSRFKQDLTALTIMSRITSMILMPSLNRAMETHFRGVANRRVSAIYLAIRLYQLDHNGNLPGQLADLVPSYLPAIPIDPFASDGRAFGYRSAPEPVIYSVGPDGKDDGGDATLTNIAFKNSAVSGVQPGDSRDSETWQRRDVLFRLTKPQPLVLPPRPAPTTDPDSEPSVP